MTQGLILLNHCHTLFNGPNEQTKYTESDTMMEDLTGFLVRENTLTGVHMCYHGYMYALA